MNKRSHSSRVSFAAVGMLGMFAFASGACGAPANADPNAASPNEEEAVHVGDSIIINPVLLNEITTCGSKTVPVPAPLAAYGCSLGVAVEHDPALIVSGWMHVPFATVKDESGNLVQAYEWACRSDFDLTAVSNAIRQGASLGSVAPGQPVLVDLEVVTITDACYSAPHAGYVMVREAFTSLIATPGTCLGSNCDDSNGGSSGGATGSGSGGITLPVGIHYQI